MREELENGMELAQSIHQAALDAGFDNCGILALDDMESFADRVTERMDAVPDSRAFYEGIRRNADIPSGFPGRNPSSFVPHGTENTGIRNSCGGGTQRAFSCRRRAERPRTHSKRLGSGWTKSGFAGTGARSTACVTPPFMRGWA